MPYSDIALLAADEDFKQRVNAAYATEVLDDPTTRQHPNGWVFENIWFIASAPGFGDAYASALAGSVERPGNDPSVISDAQILSAVQFIINQTPPPTP